MLKIYTDGSCKRNPGPGGWGAVLIFGKHIKQISGCEEQTTNNRMELTAVIKALEMLKKENLDITLYSDSKYIIDGINKNWKKTKNLDLWERLYLLKDKQNITWTWVKGHTGNYYNEMADGLARKD